MHPKTINQYLTLTEARACSSWLCGGVLYLCYAEIKATTSPFLFLAVDLPPPPLFQDAVEKNIIPQVGIHTALAKYDGVHTQVNLIHCARLILQINTYFLFIMPTGI
jgi:hypothetical protein